MFIRCLQLVVLPLVFINVIISVVDMVQIGKAGVIGSRTIIFYLTTTVIGAVIGIISVAVFRHRFSQGDYPGDGPTIVSLGCNIEGHFVTETPEGVLMCKPKPDAEDMEFVINDLNGAFVTESAGINDDMSLSDTLYQGVFEKLIANNIIGSFVEANFAAVIVFAVACGLALGKVLEKKAKRESSSVMSLLRELDGMVQTMIYWIIAFTPFAVLSLIAQTVGAQNNLAEQVENVSWLMVASFVGWFLHIIVVHYILHGIVTRSNPWHYMKHIIPAQTMALACASSAATIPVTFRSVDATGKIPKPVARFIIPLGATINMDGGAIY